MASPREIRSASAGPWPLLSRHAALFALIVVSALVRDNEAGGLREAVLWLPSGVAVVGAWWLGARSAITVALASALIRALIDYPAAVVFSGAVGSAGEALLGVFLLQRLDVGPAFSRLRDVLGLFVVAAGAPLASLAGSWVGRVFFGVFHEMPLTSGWDGWWRMNALGILVVVPVFGTCRSGLQIRTARPAGMAVALGLVLIALLGVVLFGIAPGVVGVMLLQLSLLVALFGALWFGPGGAVVIAAFTAVALALATAYGHGPFQSVLFDERPSALQLFLLTMLAVPLVLGALIAEREAALASRLRSERGLLAMQQVLPDVTYRLRADGSCSSMIVPEGGIAAFQPEDVIGRTVFDVLPPGDAERALASVQATLRGERVEPFEHRIVVGGAVRYREARYVRLSADEVLCVVRDTTDRRRLEDELRQAQKMEAVGRLAGGIAHDFNNVLTVIAGSAEAVLAALPADHPAHADAAMIVEASERAARVTRQMLAFSRQQVLAPEIVELATVVEGLAVLLHRVIGENIRLVVERGAGPSIVRVDRGQIEQVVMNLVLNARDALPRGGTVRIATRTVDLDAAAVKAKGGAAAGRYVLLSVADDGVGMDAAARARAFEPFFTTKEPGRGTGLGLATVWGVVHQSGGFAAIDSAVGAGTTVSVYLPAAAAVAASSPTPSVAGVAPRAATILVTEDDEHVRELLVRTLRAAGHAVLVAHDGAEAAAAAARCAPIDLLVTDVVMPRCGGRELAERLRAARPGLRVLFVSGYANGAFDAGDVVPPGTAFLAKPFTRETLLGKVGELLVGAAG